MKTRTINKRISELVENAKRELARQELKIVFMQSMAGTTKSLLKSIPDSVSYVSMYGNESVISISFTQQVKSFKSAKCKKIIEDFISIDIDGLELITESNDYPDTNRRSFSFYWIEKGKSRYYAKFQVTFNAELIEDSYACRRIIVSEKQVVKTEYEYAFKCK